MEINYIVTIGSSELNTSLTIRDQTQVSIQFLEDALADAGGCVPIRFLVVASVPGTEDSVAAVIGDALPLCKCHGR